MSVSSDLRKLRLRRGGLAVLEEYYAQIDAEKNDRGAAILAATFLENALEYAVSRRLSGSHRVYEHIFLNDGPLGMLHAKILVADALDIFGPRTRENLDAIKQVRNTFAHCSLPIDFNTVEIANACNTLTLPSHDPQRYRKELSFETPREKFTTCCEVIATSLHNYAAGCTNVRADLVPTKCGGFMIPVTPPALP